VEDLLLELLGFLADIVGEVLVQAALELAIESIWGTKRRDTDKSPILSAMGLILGGAVVGLLFCLLFPHRFLTDRFGFKGSSLIFAPLLTGLAMHFLGTQIRRFGRSPSPLASFWGGALFAFSVTLIRWWLIGRPR
jgi:hypothetical protein